MMFRNQWQMALALGLLLLFGNSAWAEEKPDTTTITVKRMCEGCSKKIVARLKATPGIRAVRVNVRAKMVTITPNEGTVLSPRLLWELVEMEGELPVKLEGPTGSFTSKPPN